MSYTYTAYGLNFASEFPLPELRPHQNGAPDVRIGYGDVPESLPFPSDNGIAWQAAPGKLLLTVKEVARYLIIENREVIVKPLPGSRAEDVRIFLLGSALAAVLHAQKMLVLHAGVIQTKSGAVLLMGNSGAGKSTLTAAFLKRGYAILADDKAGIALDENGVAQTLPGFPRIRLTKDAVEKLQFPTENAAFNAELDKYVVPVENFCTETIPVKAAYSLSVHNKSDIILEPLDAIEKFETLNYHTYRRRFMREPSQREAHFQILGALSKQVRCSTVVRPVHPNLIDELVARIEEDFAK